MRKLPYLCFSLLLLLCGQPHKGLSQHSDLKRKSEFTLGLGLSDYTFSIGKMDNDSFTDSIIKEGNSKFKFGIAPSFSLRIFMPQKKYLYRYLGLSFSGLSGRATSVFRDHVIIGDTVAYVPAKTKMEFTDFYLSIPVGWRYFLKNKLEPLMVDVGVSLDIYLFSIRRDHTISEYQNNIDFELSRYGRYAPLGLSPQVSLKYLKSTRGHTNIIFGIDYSYKATNMLASGEPLRQRSHALLFTIGFSKQ
jgi:hypothetical protein